MPSGIYKRTEKHIEINRNGHLGQKAWNKNKTKKEFPQLSNLLNFSFGIIRIERIYG